MKKLRVCKESFAILKSYLDCGETCNRDFNETLACKELIKMLSVL